MQVHNVESSQGWWIRTDRGDVAYQVVDARFGRRSFTTLADLDEQPIAIIRERLTGLRDSASIQRPGRPDVAIRRRLAAPGGQAWHISAPDMGDLYLIGDLATHRAMLWSTGQALARVHDRGPSTDEYRVTVAGEADRVLVLAALVTVDRLRR